MTKTSNPEQQSARRKFITTIQRLKSTEDLNLALGIIEQILENPQNVKSKIGSHCGVQNADISGPLIAAALALESVNPPASSLC